MEEEGWMKVCDPNWQTPHPLRQGGRKRSTTPLNKSSKVYSWKMFALTQNWESSYPFASVHGCSHAVERFPQFRCQDPNRGTLSLQVPQKVRKQPEVQKRGQIRAETGQAHGKTGELLEEMIQVTEREVLWKGPRLKVGDCSFTLGACVAWPPALPEPPSPPGSTQTILPGGDLENCLARVESDGALFHFFAGRPY